MDIFEKLKDMMGKGATASKNAFEKAGSAVQDFSDKSVLKIEIKQLESKRNQDYTKLGTFAANAFLSGADSVSVSTDEVKEIIEDIKSIDAEIEKKQEALSAE